VYQKEKNNKSAITPNYAQPTKLNTHPVNRAKCTKVQQLSVPNNKTKPLKKQTSQKKPKKMERNAIQEAWNSLKNIRKKAKKDVKQTKERIRR